MSSTDPSLHRLLIYVAIGFVLSAVLAVLPIPLLKRSRPPEADRVLLEIPYRLWVGRYLRVIMPAVLIAAIAVVAVALARVGWRAAGLPGAAVSVATVAIIAMPLGTMVWAMRRIFAHGILVTRDEIFVNGTTIPWSRIADLRFENHGIVLDVPSARVVRRPTLLQRTFAIDALARQRLGEIYAAARSADQRG